jgi:hypothetical protein
MVRKPAVRHSPAVLAYLSDDPDAAAALTGFERWTFSCLRHGTSGFDGDPAPADLWATHGAEFLRAYIQAHPCRRPWPWWQYSAPRWTREVGAYFDGQLPEPRQRLGGTGTPNYEALSIVPQLERGLPTGWVSAFDVAYYNGRAPADAHAWPPRSRHPREGDFAGVAIDPNDPPVYESEAAYLERHGLLTVAEKRWLADHPEALAPVTITPDETERCSDYIPTLAKSERAAPCR